VAPRPETIALIRRLVAFDTTSRDSNLALVAYVREYLEGLGIACRLSYDDDRRKANLVATLGPADRPGVVLSGHTDVVPVDGQDWTTDPFAPELRDGRLYGRGTCDMKGFVGTALAFAPEFLRRGLARPIHYALSYDEEVGCVGVRRLLPDLAALPARPMLCLVGEPTEMRIVTQHKGKQSWTCHVRGFECHSSLAHQGVNAVEYAAELIAFLRRTARTFRDDGPHDARFDPPWSTVHTGTVRGGTALNIVPADCRFEFEMRHLPGHEIAATIEPLKAFATETLLPEMRRVHPEAAITLEPGSGFPGLDTDPTGEAVRFIWALVGANATEAVSFGTEAGLFDAAGIPTVICGPGSIDQAHKPDEFVALEQIARCEAMLERLADQVCVR